MVTIERQTESLGKKLKKIRKELGLTQKEMASLLGCSLRALQYWEKGEVEPRGSTRKKIEQVLKTLIGEEKDKESYMPYISSPSFRAFLRAQMWKVLSRISAGYPSFAPAPVDIEEAIFLPQEPGFEGNFIIRVEGDSMSPLLEDGEYAVVRPVYFALPENLEGKVVVASIEGEFTIKRFRKGKKKYYLVPENPKYKPIPVNQETHIIGVVVEAISRRKIS